MQKRQGFTLVELLIVITVIAILVAMLFPVMGAVIVAYKEYHCQNNLRQLAQVIGQYAYMHGHYLPPPGIKDDLGTGAGKYTRAWLCDSQWYVDGGLLARLKMVGSPEIFLCPVHADQWALERPETTRIYWKAARTGHRTPGSSGRVVSSYAMNAYAWDATQKATRRHEEFSPLHFLLIEEHPTASRCDDAAMMPDAADKIADRHQGGGFVACFDGHVLRMTTYDFEATKTDPTLKARRWVPSD